MFKKGNLPLEHPHAGHHLIRLKETMKLVVQHLYILEYADVYLYIHHKFNNL